MFIKAALLKCRDFARLFGLEIKLSNLQTRQDLRLQRCLELLAIDTVIDAGANEGQFAKGIIKRGYRGRIVSFEALPNVWEKLTRVAERHRAFWEIAPACALGEEAGTRKFHVTSEMQSSSLLEPASALFDLDTSSFSHETVEVEVIRLDEFFDELGADENLLLKIDVQGAELMVLRGGVGIMPRVKCVLLEMSLVELYHQQPLFNEVDQFLRENGFELWDLHPFFRDELDGRLLQLDAIYHRIDADA